MVRARLDKCFANEHWMSVSSDAIVISQPILYSNHGASILDTCPLIAKNKLQVKTKPFWFSKKSCLNLIEKCWNSYKEEEQNRDFVLFLKELKLILIKWDKDFCNKSRRDIDSLQRKIKNIQAREGLS